MEKPARSTRLSLRIVALFALMLFPSRAQALNQEWEYQLDAYYTALDYTLHLTTAPIPYCSIQSEWEIYKELLKNQKPRFLIFEASVNPLPLAGVYLKRQARTLYDHADFGKDQNLIQSVTTGFEEPAALSVFLGNVIDFKPVKRKSYGDGKGYIGYLFSVGNYHIKDNTLIKDDWVEGEWKIKGDRKKSDVKLQWSFRAGAKFNANTEIADVFYIGFRRSRIDYNEHRFSWLHNSGIMYKYDFDRKTLRDIQHQLVLDKKFPIQKTKIVPTMALGFVYRTHDKYKGSLRTESQDFQVLIQPNLEF